MSNRQITREDREKARRLRAIWNQRARELNITQGTAAKQLNWSQPAISQYLNCKTALNTDAILKFAELLHISPAAIDPSLAHLSTAEIHRKRLLKVVSLSLQTESFLDAPASSDACFILHIESDDFAPRFTTGDKLVLNPDAPLLPGATAVIWTHQGLHIGKVHSVTKTRVTLHHNSKLQSVRHTAIQKRCVAEYLLLL